MITLNKENGNYTLAGLSINDLEILQEGLHRLFNESQKDKHHDFRTDVLQIDRAINPELDKYFYEKEIVKTRESTTKGIVHTGTKIS